MKQKREGSGGTGSVDGRGTRQEGGEEGNHAGGHAGVWKGKETTRKNVVIQVPDWQVRH